MALRWPILRHAAPSRLRVQVSQCTTRTMASRPDLFGNLNSKPRPTANSQLLEAMAPEPKSAAQTSAGPPRRRGIDVLGQMEQNMQRRRPAPLDTLTRAELARKSREIERMQWRQWRSGDVYAPHDLSPEEMNRYKRPKTPTADVFDVLQINPLDEYKNLPLLMDFVTSMGRLKHMRETGLRAVNQRKISKAVKRATAVGLLPRTHAHPEMLRRPGPWFRK